MSPILKEDALDILNKKIDEAGVKNRHIAEKLGVSEQYISLILSGKRKLTADKVIAISQVLGIDYRIFLK